MTLARLDGPGRVDALAVDRHARPADGPRRERDRRRRRSPGPPSNDAYAAGYEVLRSTTSGSGYVARRHGHARVRDLHDELARRPAPSTTSCARTSRTGGASTATRRRSRSARRRPGSRAARPPRTPPTPAATATATRRPRATPAPTAAAIATDASTGTNTTLSCTDAGKDRHRFWDFVARRPGRPSPSVDGIQLRADVGLNNNSGTHDAVRPAVVGRRRELDGAQVGRRDDRRRDDVHARRRDRHVGPHVDRRRSSRTRTSGSGSSTCRTGRTKDFRLDYVAVDVTYTP